MEDKKKLEKMALEADPYKFDEPGALTALFTPIIRTPDGKGIVLRNLVTPTTTVQDLRQKLADQEGFAIKEILLIYCSQPLLDGNTLQFYNITDDSCVINVTAKLEGGAKIHKEERILDVKNPLIRLTDKPDCVTFDNDPKYPRALMPCGHAVTAQTMINWVTVLFEKNNKIKDICCPLPNCNKLWKWSLVMVVANMTPEEKIRFTLLKDQRKSNNKGFKQCPHCKKNVARPENLTMFRVKCSACRGADFCFVCCNPWKGGGFQICGNSGCSGEYINTQLQNCSMKIPSGWPGYNNKIEDPNKFVKIPSIRACPNCLYLISHEDRCKHMKCKNCTKEFCFACLAIKTSSGWPCNSHTDVCPIKEKQQLK